MVVKRNGHMPHLQTINIQVCGLSDEQFWSLCRNNPDRRFEPTAWGKCVIVRDIW